MCEVLDKITMKFETLHKFSVVKSYRVSKNNLWRLFSVFSAS